MGAQVHQVVKVVTGSSHTCALLADSTVKCWGSGSVGQTGYGDTSVRGDDPGEMGNSLPGVDLGQGLNAVQLASGTSHSCAVLSNATVKCWGDGNSGKLGYGDTANRGDGPGEMSDMLPNVDLGSGKSVVQIAGGSIHTCARFHDGSLKCWGSGGFGNLGYEDTANRGDNVGEMGDNLPTVDLGTGRTVAQVDAGKFSTCALLDDSTVKCWGTGFKGLGYGDIFSRGGDPGTMGNNLSAVDLGSGRTALQISTGDNHICAVLDDATVKCWGQGGVGQLGYGDSSDRGDGPGEMGDNLPVVDLGTGRTATQIAAGGSHTCVLLDDATVKCWGDGNFGALGYGDRNIRGNEPGEMGDNLPTVDLGTGRTAVQIACGFRHTCAVLDDATVKCWGQATSGQLGYGDRSARGDDPGEMGDNLPAVDVGSVTDSPTSSPSFTPSANPTATPTETPSKAPSQSPTTTPSAAPSTLAPSRSPSTLAPSKSPMTSAAASSFDDSTVIGGIGAGALLLLVAGA